jgi:DNA processing protein
MEGAISLRRGKPGWPEALERVPRPPALLRLRGSLGPARVRRVAVVGARASDECGLAVAADLARGLAAAGISVVSGGAEGVDSSAHRGALDAGGHTVAVLGGGLDRLYPAGNRPLFARIVESGGGLLAEQEDDVHPTEFTFPERNRIVAGLSEAVVVVRAGAKSGALGTAAWARRLGVPVFAVPGDPTNPLAAGTLRLLREGARLAAAAEDVVAFLGLPIPEPRSAPQLELQGNEAALWQALGREPRHADVLARSAGLSPPAALAGLLSLEIQGLCEQRPGQRFLRRG